MDSQLGCLMEKGFTITLELAMESRFGYVPWSRESGRQRPKASIHLLTIVSNTNIINESHSPLQKYGMARGLGSCSTRTLASLRTRVAGASLPSSRRASRKVSGKTDICETFFNQESILHPPKVDHTSPEEGTRKKTQGLRPLQCNQANQRRRL